MDIIYVAAENCLNAVEGVNLENKIVLSIAIRLKAEEFMKREISDKAFLEKITGNQTIKLFQQYKKENQTFYEVLELLEKVNLITPVNIHLNAFMYEPILDMGDNELRDLYNKIKTY